MALETGAKGASNLWLAERSEVLLSVALLAVLVVLLLPLPPVLLDILLAANVGLTILLLLITISATQPLDLAVFPSLLLLMTLLRLSLNVATTRLILLNGDAGRIVATFGDFVVGGDLIVGLVVFLILIIIQFVVITKGSSRVSEVAARFTLDAMPGKQMAIDAELSSGAIDEVEAGSRRRELTREAEFYGAMDGAGKFVRGDAIAGLIITAVNLVGGGVLGVSHGLGLWESVKRYSILTIGDGLVSQIPAVIIATTAGILVTKAASKVSLAGEIGTQMLANRRPLWMGVAILAAVALIPGLPKLPFLVFAGGLAAFLRWFQPDEVVEPEPEPEPEPAAPSREHQQLDEFLQTDRMSVEIGARLVPLVDSKNSKGLPDRIASLRRDITRKHGVWVPTIRIRDNMQLSPTAYRITLGGREVARGDLHPDELLAIDPGNARLELDGELTKEPAFGLPARWIVTSARQRAEIGGYTVVDAPTVLVTHLGEIVRTYAHELLGREDLQKMLDRLRLTAPTLVDEVRPENLRIGTLHQVLMLLLQEQVPITDLARILETLLNQGGQNRSPGELVEEVRVALGRTICDRFRDPEGRVRVVVFDPRLETGLRDALRDRSLSLPPTQLERLIVKLSEQWQKATASNHDVAVLCDTALRRPLRRAIERALPEMPVVAYTEIPTDLLINAVAMIRVDDVITSDADSLGQGVAFNELASRLEAEVAHAGVQ